MPQQLTPCICARQFEDHHPVGIVARTSKIRGVLTDHMKCSAPGCCRTWTRVSDDALPLDTSLTDITPVDVFIRSRTTERFGEVRIEEIAAVAA